MPSNTSTSRSVRLSGRIKKTVAKAEALVMESGALLAQRRGLLLERHALLSTVRRDRAFYPTRGDRR
jgi:hypothetical protein